ncbi:Inner membrane protein YgjV [compost metagenome]
MLFFLGLTWLLVMPKVIHPIQLLTLLGTTLSTYALFRLEGMALRLCMLSSTVCWLVHNIWAGSWGGILLEGSFFIVNGHIILGLYRARRRGRCTSTPQL